MSQFDNYSRDYKNVMDDCVLNSGESHAYFNQYKANYILSRVVKRSSKSTLLDYGCGVGLLSECIRNSMPSIQVDGYDISSQSIKEVSEALRGQGMFTDIIDRLSGNYDVIVVSNVMHHIPVSDRMETFLLLRKLLSHNGKIVVIEHNPYNPITRRVVDKCPFDKDAVLLPKSEVLGYFSRIDMQVLRSDYIVFFPAFLKFMRKLERYLSFAPIGAQYAVVGELVE